MAIPKIIHYCWFGPRDSQPKLVRDCIASWSKLNDYQIYEWSEENYDLGSSTYFQNMMALRQYSFISDIVRLICLYRIGGIYLDTDVEVKKIFPESMLQHQAFLSFMFDCNLGTATLGAERGSPFIGKLLKYHCDMEVSGSPNNDIFTRFFLDEFPEFRLNNKLQILSGDIAVYPKEYFDCPTHDPKMGYAVHHALGSWFRKDKGLKRWFRSGVKYVTGDVLYSKISRYRGLRVSPFYDTYLEHRALGPGEKMVSK